MSQPSQHLEDIKVIKRIMEESSRFLSLSGLSGVFAGLFAIAGTVVAKMIIPESMLDGDISSESFLSDPEVRRVILLLIADAGTVLILALAAAVILSYRKAKKAGHAIWTTVTRRLLMNLFIPLATGGLFIIFTFGKIPGSVTVAATLIFYGLALINTAKFTLGEIYWLGVLEVITGLVCLLMPGYALILWAAGFGLLHIIYGLFMHIRYR
ncbi:MAG: hypothetical protein MUC78_06365 [Bacteroidales bacterium]|jgi:hypothetical protein|nr:hypothetical protein [Bacteroidales bacterium]